ncbi:MAG TPA: c-type cytochrome [Gemmatimonadaceae bacterium]
MRTIVIATLALGLLARCSAEKPAGPATPAGATAAPVATGDADAGKKLIDQYSCISCHKIPGFEGPQGSMGPSLEAFASRKAIAGGIPNEPKTVTAYLQNPQAVDPQNRMPPLGITEPEARDITAYLLTLK